MVEYFALDLIFDDLVLRDYKNAANKLRILRRQTLELEGVLEASRPSELADERDLYRRKRPQRGRGRACRRVR